MDADQREQRIADFRAALARETEFRNCEAVNPENWPHWWHDALARAAMNSGPVNMDWWNWLKSVGVVNDAGECDRQRASDLMFAACGVAEPTP